MPGDIRLVCASDLAFTEILNLDPKVAETEDFIDFVVGKTMPKGALTVSHRLVLFYTKLLCH